MKYEKPTMDVVELEANDIVCASGLKGEGSGDGGSSWT